MSESNTLYKCDNQKLPCEYIWVTFLRYSPLQEKGCLSTNYEIVQVKTAIAVLICIHNRFIIICGPGIKHNNNLQEVRILLNLKTSHFRLFQSVNSINSAAYKELQRHINSYMY
jgi:hypothetical protein